MSEYFKSDNLSKNVRNLSKYSSGALRIIRLTKIILASLTTQIHWQVYNYNVMLCIQAMFKKPKVLKLYERSQVYKPVLQN